MLFPYSKSGDERVVTRYIIVRFFIALESIAIFAQEAVITQNFRDADLSISTDILKDECAWIETDVRLRFLGAYAGNFPTVF